MSQPRDRDHDLERLLGDDHGEFGALYRRLGRSEPPRRLDRAVLGQAARAVRGRAPRRHRWLVGVGSAAGIVLAAGIAWRVGQEASMQPSAITVPAPATVDVVPVQPISETARRPAEPAPAPHADVASGAPATAGAPKREAAADTMESRAKPVPKKAAASPPAPPAPPPPPVVEQASPAPSAFPQPQEKAAVADAAPARADPEGAATARSAVDAEREAAPQSLRMRAAPAPSSSVELRRDQQLAPEAWLAQVRDLLRQGRRQQAAESLRLFHRTHPRHPVPADLRDLLE